MFVPEAAVVAALRAAGCVFAEDEARLLLQAAADGADLDALVSRRVAGEPLEHILGWVEFCGRRFAVEPGVFVPRRRTESLVALAVQLVSDRRPTIVVDLCCGCGAIGAAVAAHLAAEVHAVDIDPVAVRCAERNVKGLNARVYEGDLFAPLPESLRGTVHLIIANVPYVPTDAVSLMPPEARLHEPLVALDGGPDGLDVLRRVAAGAPRWLAFQGRVLIETSEQQADAACDVFRAAGLTAAAWRNDDVGATIVGRLTEPHNRAA
jgi:release factor glutamine methyltransferase